MALSRTDRGHTEKTWGTDSTTTITSAPFTPAANSLLVVMFSSLMEDNSNHDWTPSNTHSGSGAWTKYESTQVAYGSFHLFCIIAVCQMGSSPGSGTVTMTRNSGTYPWGANMTVLEVSGHDTTTPVRQYDENEGTGSSLTTTLASTPNSDSYVFAALCDLYGNPATIPTGYTSIDTGNNAGEFDYRFVEDLTSPGTTVSWTNCGGQFNNAITVEIQSLQSQDANPEPAVATGTGTAYDADPDTSKDVLTETPWATAEAYDAIVYTVSNEPHPDAASGSGSAYQPRVHVDLPGGIATGTGTANDALGAPHVRAYPDAATGDGTAFDTIGDAIEPPIVIQVRDDDLLELNVTQRRESFRFDVLDTQGNVIGVVHPEVPVKIDNSTDANIKRRMTGFKLASHEVNDIDVLAHRIRPVMVLQNGSEYPLGVFLFADASHPRFSYGRNLDGTLLDQGLILGQPLQQTVSFEQGRPVTDAMREVFDLAGITEYVIDASPAQLGSAVAWPAGKSDTYLKVLTDLAALAGFYAPYFDNNGVARARVAVDLETASPSLVYNDAGRIIAGSIVETNDALNAPNRYIVVDTSATINPVVAVYDLPPSAPHSIARRGFAIPRFIEAPGVGNTDQAMALAISTAQTENRTYETIHFQSPTDPRHDTFDPITFRGNTYMEVAWSITCAPGGPMEHTINRVYLNE